MAFLLTLWAFVKGIDPSWLLIGGFGLVCFFCGCKCEHDRPHWIIKEADTTVGGSACECVESQPRPEFYGAWISKFRVLTTGDIVTTHSPCDPRLCVGQRYRLEVSAVGLDQKSAHVLTIINGTHRQDVKFPK